MPIYAYFVSILYRYVYDDDVADIDNNYDDSDEENKNGLTFWWEVLM